MDSMETLKVGFIPFAAPGHMIPLMDIARIFARHGADVTYFITAADAQRFEQKVETDFKSGYKIKIHTLQFPYAEVGLPRGIENYSQSTSMEMNIKVAKAFTLLENKIEQLLDEMKADCIVSDIIHSWTTDAAARLGIPRLTFESTGYVGLSIIHCISNYNPQGIVESDYEPFVLPGLPDEIEITKSQLPFWMDDTKYKMIIEVREKMEEAKKKSHGVVINSFNELEFDYVKYYESSYGVRSWAIGPVSLWINDDIQRENEKFEVIEWLDTKEPNSVLYVSFGSMTKFPNTQLVEIAHALEESSHQFIWVVRKKKDEEEYDLPEGFEEKIKQGKRGLIIRNWTPQVLILNHPSIGGFVTHCGWNSILECVSAGQPIISWPLKEEQFFNEKFVIHVLKIAVPVGSKISWDANRPEELDIVNRDEIKKAIMFFMSGGEEVDGMRKRARELGRAANKAISRDGSSRANFVSLINELKSIKSQKLIPN